MINKTIESLGSSGKRKWMLGEMLISIIHAPPFLYKKFLVTQGDGEIEYTLDMICSILALGRFYSIF
jgi:hypothetical protein